MRNPALILSGNICSRMEPFPLTCPALGPMVGALWRMGWK